MPFPTVGGKTFQDDLETIKQILGPLILINLPESSGERFRLGTALDRMFVRIDVVSTQLYDDVQELKRTIYGSVSRDPSQTPIP